MHFEAAVYFLNACKEVAASAANVCELLSLRAWRGNQPLLIPM